MRRRRGSSLAARFFSKLRSGFARMPVVSMPQVRLPQMMARVTGFQAMKRWPGVNAPRIPSLYDLVSSVSPLSRKYAVVSMSLTLAVLMTHIYVFSSRGYIARGELREVIEGRMEKVEAARKVNAALTLEIAALKNDPETIEAIARNELSMARPRESIYRSRRDTLPAYVLSMMPKRIETP